MATPDAIVCGVELVDSIGDHVMDVSRESLTKDYFYCDINKKYYTRTQFTLARIADKVYCVEACEWEWDPDGTRMLPVKSSPVKKRDGKEDAWEVPEETVGFANYDRASTSTAVVVASGSTTAATVSKPQKTKVDLLREALERACQSGVAS